MKKTIVLLVILMLAWSVTGELKAQEPVSPGQQPNPPQQNMALGTPLTSPAVIGMPKIGYVDVSKVFDEYSRTKKSKEEMDKNIKLKEESVRGMEAELRQMREGFEAEKATLSDEVKAQKEAQIKDKSDQIQKFTDQAEEELSKKESKMTEDIVGGIYSMISSIGDKEGFSIIMDKGNIIYGDKVLDLTDRILKELEAQK